MSTESVSAIERPPLLLSGIDSLYVSYFLDTAKGTLDFEELEYQKQRVKEARQSDFAELTLGSERFALMPFGKNPYRYVLSNDAFEVRTGEKISPSAHVQFKSQFLWQCGVDDLLKRFDSWCTSLSLKSKQPEVVSRADFAFDYHLPEIDFCADDFVTRSRKDVVHRENRIAQTFSFGRGDVLLRIYDKVAEIKQQSEKFWFFELWGRQEDVWRIEFQVRRNRLHAAGIDTLNELKTLQSDLLRELAVNHTLLRTPTNDSNRARWPVHPLWRALQDDIAALPQTGLVQATDPSGTINMRLYHQLRALYGSCKGVAALISERDGATFPVDFADFLQGLSEALRPHHNEVLWHADVNRRLKALRLGQW